jgi:type IV pilus assembly protein PilB
VPVDYDKKVFLEAGLFEEDLERDDLQLFKPVGCNRCTHGYKGRFAILETLRMSDRIKRLVVEQANVQDIKAAALDEGMLTLRRCGLLNFMRGVTSVEEVERVTMAD